ncbi:hypothetical protein L1987_23857 [Smallanthus sonchifolius]|uniref:Uncharacterized protein n=1 Tax=Smallanthus sonchifolius TaxID=185202 RepID=A0ACB9IJ27_9ASTR|nr:hypothetical protein L1987_23857 [Smallanthus sonchifolius]
METSNVALPVDPEVEMEEIQPPSAAVPFELNDVFAIINVVPMMALLRYGFFHKGIVPGLCFGACLGNDYSESKLLQNVEW